MPADANLAQNAYAADRCWLREAPRLAVLTVDYWLGTIRDGRFPFRPIGDVSAATGLGQTAS
jgi:hypothetical protein